CRHNKAGCPRHPYRQNDIRTLASPFLFLSLIFGFPLLEFRLCNVDELFEGTFKLRLGWRRYVLRFRAWAWSCFHGASVTLRPLPSIRIFVSRGVAAWFCILFFADEFLIGHALACNGVHCGNESIG